MPVKSVTAGRPTKKRVVKKKRVAKRRPAKKPTKKKRPSKAAAARTRKKVVEDAQTVIDGKLKPKEGLSLETTRHLCGFIENRRKLVAKAMKLAAEKKALKETLSATCMEIDDLIEKYSAGGKPKSGMTKADTARLAKLNKERHRIEAQHDAKKKDLAAARSAINDAINEQDDLVESAVQGQRLF